MGFFSKPEIRQFHYVPRYYDPRKEAMAERRARIRRALQEEKALQESADGEDLSDENGFIPRTSQESNDGVVHHSRLQRGFLSKHRTTEMANEGRGVKVFVVCVFVVILYISLKLYGN